MLGGSAAISDARHSPKSTALQRHLLLPSGPIPACLLLAQLLNMETLPLSEGPRSSTASEYLRRVLRYQHMDFEYTTWQMLYLCVNPTRIYRTTTYHSRTKHQWARDDPAFVVVTLYLLMVAALSWCLTFGASGAEVVANLLYVVCVDFFALSALLATAGWWVGNTYLNDAVTGTTEWSAGTGVGLQPETVEWRYAFDVHCNAFFPLFLLLYVLQFLLLPLLLRDGHLATLLSNTLYLAAFSAYHYLTFLGYSELPFLRRCEYFVYPIAPIVVVYVLFLLLNINCTGLVVGWYFGS